jgi:hypothetical protein
MKWPQLPRWPWRKDRQPTATLPLLLVLLGPLAVGLVVAWVAARPTVAAIKHPGTWSREQILHAIRVIESGDRDQVPDGDNGLAIGPYQIHRIYWEDALKADPALGGDYQDCRHRAYAERVIDAYMRKWIRDDWAAGSAEVIARTHNGGPGGAGKAATLGYWEKVRAVLDGRR